MHFMHGRHNRAGGNDMTRAARPTIRDNAEGPIVFPTAEETTLLIHQPDQEVRGHHRLASQGLMVGVVLRQSLKEPSEAVHDESLVTGALIVGREAPVRLLSHQNGRTAPR